MSDVIDDLKVQIDASTNSADAKIDKFIQKMISLQSAISGIEMSGASQVASGINQISSSIQNFSERTKTADFSRVTKGLNKLAEVDVQNVSNTAHAMENFANSINGIGNLKFDTETLTNIANSISRLGRASVTEATQNLEFLKTSMVDFVSGMNNVGSLSFNPDSLYKLVSSVSRLGGVNATQAVQNLPQISTYLHSFVSSMNSVGGVTFNFEGLNSLVNNISRLGGAKATQATANLKPIKDQILRFVSGLNGIGALSFDTSGLENLVSSITKLGGKASTNAVPNIKELGMALKEMMATLSGAPRVSENLIQMINALAKLASNGSKVSSASNAMSNGLKSFTGGIGKAKLGTKGLAASIGMFYAKWWSVIRGMKGLWKATESSMDYIETLNYFDAAWGQVADNAVGSWKQSGYDSAEAYAKSFSKRAQELTGKMSGFMADENGNLKSTGAPSLGIDPERLMNYQATFGQMASSMGVASETALQLSNALTMIGADLASVKNLNFKDVWDDMASGMVGMSRTLDKYGVNIRNVNLQEKLSELGINAKITALNQQDKALLRGIILLDSTRYAWGDLAKTIGAPSNQLRLLESNFANLARTLGNLFLPIVAKVLPYINGLVIAVQRLFSWIGGLLGIKVGDFSSSIGSAATDFSDMEDAADGIADSTGDAAKNTKKMADNLQSFDKLNVVSSGNDSGSGGSGGKGGASGGLLDDAFLDAFSEYQKAWDAAFANVENNAQAIADRIVNAFKAGDYYGIGRYISNGLTGALESINWPAVYSVASSFGTGLAEFFNGLITPELFGAVGKTIAGYLNTEIYAALAFGLTFDWTNLGNSIASGINNFFSTFDFAASGQTLSTFTIGLLDALTAAVEKTNWYEVGEKIGVFLSNLDWKTILDKTGKLVADGLVAAMSLYIGSASTAPVETALVTLLVLAVGSMSPIVIVRALWKKITGALATMFVGGISIPSLVVTFGTFAGKFSNTAAFQVFGTEIIDIIDGFIKETFGEKVLTAMGDSLFIAVGTGIGLVFGGPVGAIVGFIVSALVDDITKWEPGTFWENFSNKLFNFNYTKSLQDSSVKYFEKAFSSDTFIEFGENIVKSLGTGILSGVAYLGEPVVDLVTWIGDSIKGALGISVPEKESKEYGQEIVNNIGEGGKAGAPNAANAITDAVTSGIQSGENTTKFVNSGIYGANKVLEGGKSLNTEMQNLGSGWAAYSNEGLKQKFEELQKASTPQILQSWAQTGIINPFTNIMGIHSPSTVFAGFGAFIVGGLNEGIENNQESSKGVIGTWVEKLKGWFTGLLDINSPSGLFADYGGFTVFGFNEGVTDNMKSSSDLMAQWASNISSAFDISNVTAPDVGATYSVNRKIFDMVDTTASLSFDNSQYDFKSDISAELKSSLSGIIDYSKLANTVAQAMEQADITAKIGSEEVWGSTKDSWNKEYKKLNKSPVPV